jgi:hypothetical protein|tara:strand:- start:126 stop:359 length:234 start_codon:yes stop_codon:yes gene_type:complete
MNNKKYIILNVSELDSLDYNELSTTSKNTARQNLAGDKAVVSYEGTTPSALAGKTEYTNAQINTILDDISNGWYVEE